MEQEDRIRSRRGWRPPRLMVLVVVVLLVVGAAALLFASKGQAAETQPIAFPHVTMVQAGIDCLFCHTDAMRSPAAGMPSVEKCVGCHKIINPNAPEIQKVMGYWDKQEAIPWLRVNILPRFVYFTHEVHVVKGNFNCERCHGDVGHMTIDKPVVRMNMGWCLNCHEQFSESPQIKDCFVCHQ